MEWNEIHQAFRDRPELLGPATIFASADLIASAITKGFSERHDALRRIEDKLDLLLTRQEKIMDDLDTILRDLQDYKTVEQGVVAILTKIEADLAAALGAPKLDPAKIKAIRDFIASSKSDLAAAIVTGTAADAAANPPAPVFALSPATLSLTAGAPGQQLTPQNATGAVTYVSSNPAVAAVDGNGNVTGESAGTATITATDSATPTPNTATCSVTVS